MSSVRRQNQADALRQAEALHPDIVFPEHLIAAHEALMGRRRQLRADGELRSASSEEWAEFEQHFLLRKVALGDCHRPYGAPFVHEHACPLPLPPRRSRPARTA
jgi:hypothetical protein